MTSQDTRQMVIRVGVIGLGGAGSGMTTRFFENPRFDLIAVADHDAEILGRFKQDYPQVAAYPKAEGLCESKNVDFVYIGTPNQFHREHSVAALESGKHVLVEKPMTVSFEDAQAMADAADRSGKLLGVNVKHSFEPRIQQLREYTKTGEFGELRMLHYWRYQDWLYRPRSPDELNPEWGGTGLLWRQGGHQLDLLRTIGRGLVRSVRGSSMVWDPARRVNGAHSAYLEFASGAVCTAVYSGNDRYNTHELVYGFRAGELVDPAKYAAARRELQSHTVEWEAEAARSERYGGERRQWPGASPGGRSASGSYILGGPLIASYDHADIKLSPGGLMVYGDEKQWEIPLNTEEDGIDFRINAFYDSIVAESPLPCDGRWGAATVEVLEAIAQSGRERREILLSHQVAYAD